MPLVTTATAAFAPGPVSRVTPTAADGGDDAAVADLTRRLAAGDEAAFREFHQTHFDPLYRFLLGVTRGHEHAAQDALQETFVRVLRHVRRFDSADVWWSWLKAVARSAARDGGRKQRRYDALLERFGFAGPNHENQQREPDWRILLDEALAELPPLELDLVTGKHLRGESVAELARASGLSAKAVESRLTRTRRQLAESILGRLRRS